MSGPGPMIEAKGLSKSFNSHKVLDRLDLSITRGETLVIIGRSGCGKSVLLKHMIGLVRADGGRMLIDGTDITALPVQKLNKLRMRFGMLFQAAALFDSMTVGENVGFSLAEHTDMSEKEIANRVAESLELVGLKGIQDQSPAELSGGMKKGWRWPELFACAPRFCCMMNRRRGSTPSRRMRSTI